MFKITDNRKMKMLESEGNHNRNMSQASFNGDGTITIQNCPYMYEGEVQTIVLGRDKTMALVALFKKLSLIELIRMENEMTAAANQ